MDIASTDRSPVQDAGQRDPSCAVPQRSETLQRSLEMGEMIGTFLGSLTQATLEPGDHRRLQQDITTVAARAAYGGLALWAIGSVALGEDRWRRVGEAVAGVSLGLLRQPPRSPSLN